MSEIKLTPPATPVPSTVEVTNVGLMANVVANWNKQRIELLTHLKGVPEGTEVTIGDDSVLILAGDVLAGFQLGLTLALEEISDLPFVSIEEVTEEASPALGG